MLSTIKAASTQSSLEKLLSSRTSKEQYVIPTEEIACGVLIFDTEMPENCNSCAIARLRIHSIYSDLEKTLSHYLIRRAWLVSGVAERGLLQDLLDEANANIEKCQAEMAYLKPSVVAEWQQFQKSRKGW